MKKPALINLALAAATLLAPVARATAIERDANAQVILQEGRTVLIYPTNGTFTVTEPGEVELLLVGGGGGGGDYYNEYAGAGGGGAGGVLTNIVTLAPGIYSVEVGAGGARWANGKSTTLSLGGQPLFTAYGGGRGQGRFASRLPSDGASGGGGQNNDDNAVHAGAKAIYADNGNLGHDGGSSSASVYGAGGGGGAGTAGANGSGGTPGAGGNGIEVPIIAPGFYYGGGGAGWRSGSYDISGGTGGGGATVNGVAKPGEDGKGGGGAGTAKGGSGIFIMAFARAADSTAKDGWFECAGGDEVLTNRTSSGNFEVRIFKQSGTLIVDGDGTMEILAVGGGGGGGIFYTSNSGTAGGGAGGVVHYTDFPIAPGTYAITIGEGGGVSTNGSPTTGLGIVAYGGGAGDNSTWYGIRPAVDGVTKDGASGGGGATHDQNKNVAIAGGKAIYGVYANLGYPGGQSGATGVLYSPAGGGGAGAPGGDGNPSGGGAGAGGDGYPCSITGTETYYGGGGAGWSHDSRWQASGGRGGGGSSVGGAHAGEANTGGGGSGLAAGGSGVFIVRYRLKPTATTIVFR